MDFKNVITNRRAVNFFDPEKSVSDKQIREIIEMAATAPSSILSWKSRRWMLFSWKPKRN